MITYCKKWYIIRKLSNECISSFARENKFDIDKTKEAIRLNQDYYPFWSDTEIKNLLSKRPKEIFVNLGQSLEKISKKQRSIIEYRKILEQAESEGLIKFMEIPQELKFEGKGEVEFIGVTGKGFEYSRIDSLLQEIFLGRYAGWVALIIVIFSAEYIVNIKRALKFFIAFLF